MKASEMFKFARERCPIPPSGVGWADWIAVEIRTLENLQSRLNSHYALEQSEDRRHEQAVSKLNAELHEIQKTCPHDFMRATAEDDPQCRICGFSN